MTYGISLSSWGEIFPSKRDNIEKLKNSFIRYALVKP